MRSVNITETEARKRARERYEPIDSITIDFDAETIQTNGGGVWIAAWVLVDDEPARYIVAAGAIAR